MIKVSTSETVPCGLEAVGDEQNIFGVSGIEVLEVHFLPVLENSRCRA